MAAQSRRADPALEQILFDEGYRFDFFQAVRVLERLYPERRPVGLDSIPANEAVHFRSLLSLTFPPSAIHEVIRPDDGTVPAQMTVSFMGLAGLMGVLPRHYTELLLDRVRNKDFTLRDFLDIFNHRVISLFYRAWEKYRFPIAYERSRLFGRGGYDQFSLALFYLVGMGTNGLRDRLKFGDQALLYYSGLAAQQPHSTSALEATLSDYFSVPVIVKQFVGNWLVLEKPNRTRMGKVEANNELGLTSILGSKCWDQQAGFRLVVGPLTFQQFRGLLPCESGFLPVVELTRFFAGQTLDFDVQLVLKAAEVPACELKKPGPTALRLGWSSWLKSKEFSEDAGDAVLGPHLTRINTKRENEQQRTRSESGITSEVR
jgi:type VI secretion system protein ImpH